MIFHIFISLIRRSIYGPHIFMFIDFISHGFITNPQNDQLPVVLLAQMVEHCTGFAKVMGSTPPQAWIFSHLTSELFIDESKNIHQEETYPKLEIPLTIPSRGV